MVGQRGRGAARPWAGRVVAALALLTVGVVSMLAAAVLTPPVTVTVLGQDVRMGAVAPSPSGVLSGPGVAELFGEGPIETVQQFEGPLRPRIVWQRFNRDAAAGAFLTTTADGRATMRLDTTAVGQALARGWLAFLVRLLAVAGIVGALTYLVAITAVGAVRGARWRQQHARHSVRPVLTAALAGVVVTVAAAGLTLASARAQLGEVASLADLTGTAPLVPPPAAAGPPRSDLEVAVIGDSTAAGVGNAPIAEPTEADLACERSSDAYAQVLQSATGWRVENLACASATIDQGLLGAQPDRRPVVPPPQVGVLKSITSLRMVVVSIGANDIGWSDFLAYCYRLSRCDDQATQQLILSRLETFRLQYAQLLQQLSALPSRPDVVITGYYDPFGQTFDCPALQDPNAPDVPRAGYGFAAAPGGPDQQTLVQRKVEPLRSILAQLNSVLQQGAEAFGFTSVTPSFQGHELCSDQPWVQGLSDPYPFHPRAAGELAIAAALLPHLVGMTPA